MDNETKMFDELRGGFIALREQAVAACETHDRDVNELFRDVGLELL